MARGKIAFVLAAAALMKPTPPWRPKPGSSGEACPRCREDYDNCPCAHPTAREGE